MFLPWAGDAARTNALFNVDTSVVAYLIDAGWFAAGGGALPPAPIGVALNVNGVPPRGMPVNHLIYAYMVENTRSYEIFRRVAWELLHGERLGQPLSPTTHQWLRTTEALFFSDWAPSPLNLVSRVRPELAASRRNAYYRMFGMDLNHGADDGQAVRYEKPAVANRDFVATFEDFLRLVWRAVENSSNAVGPNETDPEAIGNRALLLQNMLNARRGGANRLSLLRDEFVHVATLAWFNVTVASDNDVVANLRAGGPSEEERLRLIGERVGVPAHARSHSYFQVAQPIARLLTLIEAGNFSNAGTAPNLYLPAIGNQVRDDVLRIINHWSVITGRDMKAGRVMISATSQVPASAAVARPASTGNGRVVAAASPGTN